MDLSTYKRICSWPNVFNRSDLEMTVSLLRKDQPSLCLAIRNILMEAPIEKPLHILSLNNTDHFYIELSQEQINRAIETLTDLNLGFALHDTDNANQILQLRTLIFRWLDLAKTFLYQETFSDTNDTFKSATPQTKHLH